MKNIRNILKNGRLVRLVALLSVFSLINIFPMRTSEMGKAMASRYIAKQRAAAVRLKQEKQGLLIFLDDSEKGGFGAVGYELLTALYQEAGPIIASTSLLYTLTEQSEKDTRSIDIILNERNEDEKVWLKKTDSFLKNSLAESSVKRQDMLIGRIGFKQERWIIKKINNSLNLLIPQSYLESLKIDNDKVKKFDNVANVTTDIELQLGFKVNHMETIDVQSIGYTPFYTRLQTRFSSYFSQGQVAVPGSDLAYYFTDSLDAIFCKKSDYSDKKISIPKWFIRIMGHGTTNRAVADLSFKDFKSLLNFLENKINTQLLVVLSCYAAGVNANEVYGEIKLETQQYYSFPVIIQGLNNTIVTTHRVRVDFDAWNKDKKIQLITPPIDFVNFFKKAKELEGNYSEVIRPITINVIENTPQIKLPGIEWFSVIEIDKKIVSIGSILVKTRDPQQPLDVVSFFKKDPDLILLYTNDIPFELAINSSALKAIVSMAPAQSVNEQYFFNKDMMKSIIYCTFQKIKKISSTALTFKEIVELFKSVSISSGEATWVSIDEMRDNNNIINKDIFIFGTDTEGMRVYFKDKDNVLFTGKFQKGSEVKFEKVESDSDDANDYHKRILVMRFELSRLSKEAKEEITLEQTIKIENVLIKQHEEKQKTEEKK